MKRLHNVLSLAVVGAFCAYSGQSVATGFAIGTQSGSGTGNAYAGGAAAEDASTVWYNPAGMTLLRGASAAAGGSLVRPSLKFQNTASTGVNNTGNFGGDGGSLSPIPFNYFVAEISPKWRFGIGLNAPFGQKTDYNAGWDGQYLALKSEIYTINFNPSVAYQVSDKFSIGAGFNLQYINADLSNNNAALAGASNITASDTDYGYNVGAMLNLTPNTRIGVHYRSQISYNLKGGVNFFGPAAPLLNGNITARLAVPATASVSFFSALTPQWDVMADATWTGWSKMQAVSIVRTSGALLSTLSFNWDDTWRFSAGANFKPNQTWKFRVGVAFDETPTNDALRTPRLPDEDRKWLAFGAQYALSSTTKLDLGYAHEFFKDAAINQANPPGTPAGTLVGRFKGKADIVSLQLTHQF